MIEIAAGGVSSLDERLEWGGYGGSTRAMGGEADRNLDSPLYSHRLPLVVHLDMTYPCESHKFVSWRVILSTSCRRL